MALLEDAILRDTLANRPTAGSVGRLFYDTTNSELQRDNGSSWDSVEGAGGGGGGVTQAYLGYNTVGGSWVTFANRQVFYKKITTPAACELLSVGAYVQNNSSNVQNLNTGLWSNASGAPKLLLSYNLNDTIYTVLPMQPSGGRWIDLPIGVHLAASTDYWIGAFVLRTGGANAMQIAYDGSGSDQHHTAAGDWIGDGDSASLTVSSNKYSLRANTIS